ncbi:hypothetical protein [Solitalea lacus]|uniref:hypothetical protein n=1 Tax=Solitalea lacus TaxID=2911172 RepID=UPI001EDBB76F|nr:hypothetical protein [Solitalea lacus]UKJ06633.1 hypothetical protein L2B55_13975 [Solitalea lacus]
MIKLRLLFILTLLFLFSKPSEAQNISPYKYSFGLNLVSYNEQIPVVGTDYNNNDYVASYANELIFKVRNNLFSFRLGARYNHFNDQNPTPDCATCASNTGKYQNLKVGLGFEREFLYTLVRPVIGLDLFYYRSDYKGQTLPSLGVESNYTNNRNGAGFSPFIGIKFYPVDRVTIMASSSIESIWFHEKSETETNGIKYSTPGHYSFETYFNPIAGLTLIYNFGSED